LTAIAGDPQANIDFFAVILGLRLVKLTVNFDHPTTHDRSPRPNGLRSGGSHPEGSHGDGAARNDFRLGQQRPPMGTH
jgi:glyoxalase family protein